MLLVDMLCLTHEIPDRLAEPEDGQRAELQPHTRIDSDTLCIMVYQRRLKPELFGQNDDCRTVDRLDFQ